MEHWLGHTLGEGHPAEFIITIAGGSLLVAIIAIVLAYLIYGRKPLATAKAADPLAKSLGFFFRWMNQKFMVDELYQAVALGPYKKLADFFAHPVDQGVIDGIVNGFGKLAMALAGLLRKLQTGFARTYALSIFAGIILILVYLVTRI
jgi:NADH-quinone oxidoreductase subunit L